MTTNQPPVASGQIGEPVLRVEDARFLTGNGQFVDDIYVPNAVHAYVLRSPHAHARIRRIDVDAARRAPGVLLVLTADDLKREGLGELQSMFLPPNPLFRPSHPVLASDKVRHAGDRVALVVAETLHQAKDAAELIEVDYDLLGAVAHPEDAVRPDAPRVWDEANDNVCFHVEKGSRDQVAAAFAEAAHISKLQIHYPRASASPIEPRATIGYFDRYQGQYMLHATSQAPYRARDMLAAHVLHVPESSFRVVAPDVGGGFGMKGAVYPEDALVVWAASKLGRPVKWTADRAESFLSDMHGRDLVGRGELALAADGRVLALRAEFIANLGAYLSYSAGAPGMSAGSTLTGVYDIRLVHSSVRGVFTNTAPLGPYRGSGRPEATYLMERLIDKAALEMKIDPVTIRQRNLIKSSAMPYLTAGGHTYDCGDFELVLNKALDACDWSGFSARRKKTERAGRRRGIGLAMHCESSGLQSERMEVRVDPNGSVTVHVGTLATGQGHETMYAQMISTWLHVPLTHIRVLQGDTDRVLFGRGTFAERSATVGGSALKMASGEIIEKAKRIAAWALEADEKDVEFDKGLFRISGTNRSISFRDVARKAYTGSALRPEFGLGLPPKFGLGLDGVGVFDGEPSYPNGCIACEVEVDVETGVVQLEKLTIVDDVGVVINPLMLDGQLLGSVAQGIGQILGEHIVYDKNSGQLLSGSFMDYGMPRAEDIPSVESIFVSIPCKTNPLGVKGGTEVGNIAVPPAIVNAIIDALAPLGIDDLPLPIRPEQIWRALRK